MFTAEGIKSRFNQKPFRPLRIIASEGHIGFASPEHPTIYDRTIRLAMSHVVGLEDLPMPTPTAGKNGAAS